MCLVWGCVSGPGGCACRRGTWGGVPAQGRCLPAGGLPQTCPPVNRMTDRCKNITLATTSLRPVKMFMHCSEIRNCNGRLLKKLN